MRRASLYTLGCRVNQAESDSLASGLMARGYRIVREGEEADLCVVNTCAVTEQADAKCRYLIRSILRTSPLAFVAVTGCYAQADTDRVRSIIGVDLVVGTDRKMDLPRLLPSAEELLVKVSVPRVIRDRRLHRAPFQIETYAAYDRATRPNIKIQDGCDFFCTFCIIPFTRGREQSRSFDDVLCEARAWASRGHREVVLTGVNLGSYRDDGRDLVDLIRALESVDGLVRIRIASIEPTTVDDRLLDWMAASKKLCPYLHIPLQSGSDRILSAMNRRYNAAGYEDLIRKAASRVRSLGLGTDVLVGFPGEEEEDFEATARLLDRLPFAYFHVFPYSKRKGTGASRLDQTVSPKRIKRRAAFLQERCRSKRQAFYARQLGQVVSVLFEREEGGIWSGLTPDYIRVSASPGHAAGDLSGRIRRVRIASVEGGTASGILI